MNADETSPEQESTETPKRFRILPVHIIGIFALVTLVLGLSQILLNSGPHRPINGQEAWRLDMLRQLGEAMSAYAHDHQGSYPTGESSVEVFNQLIAGGYLQDYRLAMYDGVDKGSMLGVVSETGKEVAADPEKTRLTASQVSWDATANARADDPAGTPLLYSTGFEVAYQPGTRPTPAAGQQEREIFVLTVDGQRRIYRLDEVDSWEFPFMPTGVNPTERQQLRPVDVALEVPATSAKED